VDQLVQPPPTRILGSPEANQLIGTSAVDSYPAWPVTICWMAVMAMTSLTAAMVRTP